MIKDFAKNVLKTVTLGRTLAGSTFSNNTFLYRGTLDYPVGNSFTIRILDTPRGMNAAHFQELATQVHPPGGQQLVENSKDGKLQAQSTELTARLNAPIEPQQDRQGREKWNNDDDGPKPSKEALVGSAGPLDKQGMAPF